MLAVCRMQFSKLKTVHSELSIKISVLFLTGALFSLLFSTLLIQREVTSLPTELIFSHTVWWMPLAAGFLSLGVGMLYPKVDRIYGQAPALQCDWPWLIRCAIIYFGINQACMKLDYMNSVQLSVTLAVMSILMWWIFDRTVSGLIVGILATFIFTSLSSFFVYHGFARYKKPDFFLIRSWLPSLFFSAVIVFGTFGRHLSAFKLSKEHED